MSEGTRDEDAGESAGVSPSRRNPTADFIAGIVIFLVALYALVESINMPFYGDSGVWGSPGLTPGLISAVLMLLSAFLMLRSRRLNLSEIRIGLSIERFRGLAVLAIILAYAAAVPTLGYVPATFLMLVVFQLAFARRHSLAYFLVWGVGLSAVLTAILWWLFGEFFFVPLPKGPLGV